MLLHVKTDYFWQNKKTSLMSYGNKLIIYQSFLQFPKSTIQEIGKNNSVFLLSNTLFMLAAVLYDHHVNFLEIDDRFFLFLSNDFCLSVYH